MPSSSEAEEENIVTGDFKEVEEPRTVIILGKDDSLS